MEEAFWNEDEMFRPNILENFHFFAKEASIWWLTYIIFEE